MQKQLFPTQVGNRILSVELFPEAELFDQLAVALQVILAQIGEQAFPLAYHGHQAAVCGKVFLILLKMTGNVVDPLGQ